MTFVESMLQLTTALIVLGVGAVISYYLGPRITRKWEEGRKKVDIRIDLFERALSIVEEGMFYGLDHIGSYEASKLPNPTAKRLNSYLDDAFSKDRSVKARLRMYMPELEDDWVALSGAVRNYVFVCYDFTYENKGKRLDSNLLALKEFVGDSYLPETNLRQLMKEYDKDLWGLVEDGIGKKSSKFLQRLKIEPMELSH